MTHPSKFGGWVFFTGYLESSWTTGAVSAKTTGSMSTETTEAAGTTGSHVGAAHRRTMPHPKGMIEKASP